MSNSPTEAAIKAAGRSLSEVARSFGFKSTQSVANWVINDQVPSERVLQISTPWRRRRNGRRLNIFCRAPTLMSR